MKAFLILLCSLFLLASCAQRSVTLKELKIMRDDNVIIEMGEFTASDISPVELRSIFQCTEEDDE